MLFGDGPKGNKFANAGVGENNIDSPLHLRDGLVKTIKVSQVGNVSLNSGSVGADYLHGFFKFLLAAARDEDIGTLFDEKFSSSQPNPFCPAGDDGGLAFELSGHCLSPLLLSWNSPAPMLHSRSLECEYRLTKVIGQMVRPAQQDGEAITRSIFGEIFFRYGRVPLDPVGPRHFFKPLPQFSINDVPCLLNLFVRRNVGSRLVGIRDEGDIKLGMKSFSQAQQHRVVYGGEMPP